MDAFTEEAFAEQVERLRLDMESQSQLAELSEGGTPLSHENRYLCAKFVKELAKERPQFIPHLSRLASIGLLTEVVEDFIKPTTAAPRSDLTLILDAPVALTLLGVSGQEARDDITNVISSLRSIGCSVIAFPVSCEEMTRNLASMLALSPMDRHGPTHDAMRKREVEEDYVRSVMNNPERALQQIGVTVRPLDLEAFPGGARFFSKELYEEFFSGIMWKHGSVDAREHDAICTALTMRLRAGVKSSDPLGSKFVFVTTNPVFVRHAREFCRRNRLLNERQTPPVILQRELATIAWLRTGLAGAEGAPGAQEIPRSHLLASCERVLRPRQEVVKAVHAKLSEFAPEKTSQYELLLSDHRSVQRLMDETLGAEHFVTAENAEKLLEEMRRATAQEVQEEAQKKLRQQAQRHGVEKQALREESEAKIRSEREAARLAVEEKEQELADRNLRLTNLSDEHERLRVEAEGLRRNQVDRADRIAAEITRFSARVDKALFVTTLILAAAVVYRTIFALSPNTPVFWTPAVLFALISIYHTIQELRQKPKFGFENILNALSRRKLRRELERSGLDVAIFKPAFEVTYGRVTVSGPARRALLAPPREGSDRGKDQDSPLAVAAE
ncbi:hypothetical protein JNW90_21165 [Micromonospora sp. STR1s_5]|nr:hypothetical protein [Micromonospora sp. STR1s_5]